MTYTVENADLSTALMVEIFEACTPDAVRPGRDALRRRIEDFTNAGWIREFGRRTTST
jgi:hypothetical protein